MSPIVEPSAGAIAEAAQRLAAGDVVAFPTETVYGLGAAAHNVDALRKVYALKGRPFDNPLIAHVLDVKQAQQLVATWDDRADALARRFWPGPLTLVLPKRDDVPDEATAGLLTIAVRSPNHPVARQLLEAFGRAICAPSANRSGHVSPTRAEHVAEDFADAADLMILNGGASLCGIESTVLDLSTDTPRILRPGSVDAQQLSDVLGEEVLTPTIAAQTASPGTSPRHYAPRTPVELLGAEQIRERLLASRDMLVVISITDIAVAAPHHVIPMPGDAEAYAARLYDALRRADAMGCAAILVQRPPHTGMLWQAVQDRLIRAATAASRE